MLNFSVAIAAFKLNALLPDLNGNMVTVHFNFLLLNL